MKGLQHIFIAGVICATNIKYAVRSTKGLRYDDLYITQSMLDSSCGLVCVLQAAMVLCEIPRAQAVALTAARRKPLRALWLVARETYFEGTTETEIQAYVHALSPNLTCTSVTTQSAKRIGQLVAAAVRAGHVPMVRFESKYWCHWALVTGIELKAGQSLPCAFLTLDSSASQPLGSFYNARLDLQAKRGNSVRAKPLHTLPYRFVTGYACTVRLNGLVIIQRGQPP